VPNPHARTWTLTGLDRDLTYRLWLDPDTFRWEVAVLDDQDVVPRPSGAVLGAAGKRSAAGPQDGSDDPDADLLAYLIDGLPAGPGLEQALARVPWAADPA
jgi:hypothetical protein